MRKVRIIRTCVVWATVLGMAVVWGFGSRHAVGTRTAWANEASSSSDHDQDSVDDNSTDTNHDGYDDNSADTDSDGNDDSVDTDDDNDNVPDNQDNCQKTYNPDQADSDDDGVGDTCDLSSGNETHDLAVTSFSAAPNPANRGSTVTFSYTVTNQGNQMESELAFRLTYNGKALGRPQRINRLGAGQSKSGTINVKVPSNTQPGDYLITGQVSQDSHETDTADNSQTVNVTVQ